MLNKSIEGYDSYRADNKNDLTHKNDAKYIDMVMSLLECDASYKRRIKEDLYIMLEEKRVQKGGLAAETLLGDPFTLANEFAENFDLEVKDTKESDNRADFKYGLSRRGNFRYGYYGHEYKSKKTLFGIPLVHVNYKSPFAVAKGIIAVGPVAIGGVACGGIGAGILSFSGLSIGLLLALGGLGISLFFALGGMAVAGILAVGGMALSGLVAIGGFATSSLIAIGGYAQAKVAIGAQIKALVGFYTQSGVGKYTFEMSNDLQYMGEIIRNSLLKEEGKVNTIIEFILRHFFK